LPPTCPLLRDVHHSQIQHLEQAVIRGKHRLGFGNLPELTVEALYGIGGIDQPPHLLRKLEIGAQICPVVTPGLGNYRVFLVSMLGEGIQSGQS